MAEDLRAVAQRSQIFTLPDGSKLELRPLLIRDWATLEEEALQAYKRSYLETYTRNLDLLPGTTEAKQAILMEKFQEAAQLTPDKIPPVVVDAPKWDGDKLVRDGNGDIVRQPVPVPYAQWWFGNTLSGSQTAIWLSIRRARPNITPDEADAIYTQYGQEITNKIANAVAELSRPTLGNAEGQASP
jgi:hypothetical protein